LIREREKVVLELVYAEILPAALINSSYEKQKLVRAQIREIVDKDPSPLTSTDRGILFQNVLDEVFGFGPLGQLLRDPTVRNICVNGPSSVYFEREGRFTKSSITFENNKHLRDTIEKIIQPLGLRLDENNPIVRARLPNGSSVTATIPPASMDGTMLTIRCLGSRIFSLGQLAQNGTMSPSMANILKAYAKGRLNVIFSGLEGAGRLVLLNAFSAHVDARERIISIEPEGELRLQHEHWIRMWTGEQDKELSVKIVLAAATEMLPDRIILGDCDGPQALDYLEYLDRGRIGNIAVMTARSARDCIRRLEMKIRLADPNLPADYARELIAENIHVIVQAELLDDGTYRVSEIAEVSGIKHSKVVVTPLVRLKVSERDEKGLYGCDFVATGSQSRFISDLTYCAPTDTIDER
jgi:pilus assembly protein CpaF